MSEIDATTIATLVKGGATALSVALGSKPAALFIEKVASALGWYMEPKQIVRKARAEAAASLIKAEVDQEAKTLEQRTATRIINEELIHQKNIEAIVLGALPNIKEEANPKKVDDDWLSIFFENCRRISNEDLQKLWTQILAGEMNKPGTFSPRTIQALSAFTKMDAITFKKLSTFVWRDNLGFAMAMYGYSVLDEILAKNEMNGGELYHLDDINLILYQNGSQLTMSSNKMSFDYFGRKFRVLQKDKDGVAKPMIKSIPVGYVKLTQIGRELSLICNAEPNWDYMNGVLKLWRDAGFELIEIIPDSE